ncbi:protein tyrosine phosphatase [Candidatus Nitromaritima sp. SCGC AAA799-A02]|nr:protein tyrosine phosphatase [Candidatus Nitromaritima sp. SCGC AAA799-C22]KMP10624.1 protein tyrosine phosphatase [Candidatus Nitromaritima sp. SCGC AAA799-A02]
MDETVEISFVCLGNICRSPLAQGLFQDLVNREALGDQIIVSSAGTSGWHVGDLPDNRMRQTARNKGIQLKNRARQFQKKDFDRFDLVLAMDRSNLSKLEELAPQSLSEDKLMLFRSFDPKADDEMDVPDPYYGGASGFENVFQIVQRTCPPLLDYIKSRFLNGQ